MKTIHRILFADVLYWTSVPFLKWLGISYKNASVTRRSIHWILDLRESIDLSIFFTGTFEPEVTRSYLKILRKSDVVIDIGANSGAHTLRFAQAVGSEGQVFAFEPTAYALQKLISNLTMNPELQKRTQIEFVFLNAIDSSEKPATVSSSFRLETFSEKEKRNEKDFGFAKSTLGAESITFDSWCQKKKIQSVDMIKLDVDGHEPEVISGSLRSLKKFQPMLLVEIAPGHFIDQPERFHSWLKSIFELGYSAFTLGFKSLPTSSAELWEKTTVGSYENIWLVPETRTEEFLKRGNQK